MKLNKEIIPKIIQEEEKWPNLEFGGWVIVNKDKNLVEDIIFDTKNCSEGYVKVGSKKIRELPKKTKKKVRGFFHKHPIEGLSQLDMRTIARLTKFWGECYTLVLQSNGKLLLIKTVFGRDFLTQYPIYAETFREELPYR